MTNATTKALQIYWHHHNFTALTGIVALGSVLLLVAVLIEKELLRAMTTERQARSVRVCNVVLTPTLIWFVTVVLARFIKLS